MTLFSGLGAIGIVGPDEPRYAWIARAMAATGDWVTPRLYGQPWFEKPILYYWTAAFGFLLHLPTEWALRLPSAFAALASAIAIGCVAAKFYGPSALRLTDPPILAPLLFSTTVAGIGFARAATPDMLFSAFITLAMAAAAAILQRAKALGVASSADSRTAQHYRSPAPAFRSLPRSCRTCKGPCRNSPGRRRDCPLGRLHKKMEPCVPAGTSLCRSVVLCRRASMVRALRAPQS